MSKYIIYVIEEDGRKEIEGYTDSKKAAEIYINSLANELVNMGEYEEEIFYPSENTILICTYDTSWLWFWKSLKTTYTIYYQPIKHLKT